MTIDIFILLFPQVLLCLSFSYLVMHPTLVSYLSISHRTPAVGRRQIWNEIYSFVPSDKQWNVTWRWSWINNRFIKLEEKDVSRIASFRRTYHRRPKSPRPPLLVNKKHRQRKTISMAIISNIWHQFHQHFPSQPTVNNYLEPDPERRCTFRWKRVRFQYNLFRFVLQK